MVRVQALLCALALAGCAAAPIDPAAVTASTARIAAECAETAALRSVAGVVLEIALPGGMVVAATLEALCANPQALGLTEAAAVEMVRALRARAPH